MNKKYKAAVWILILLLFSGCGQKTGLPDFGMPFACSITLQAGEDTLKGNFSRQLLECYTLEVTWPPELSGLTFCQYDGEITVSLEQMSAGFSTPFPATSGFGALTQVLDHLARQESPNACQAEDGYLGFSGTCEAGDYIVIYHAQTKQPATAKIGDGLLVEFTFDGVGPES